MSLAFTKKDLEMLLNNSPLVAKKKFDIKVEKFAEHPKSVEYILSGQNSEGKVFSFHYAQMEGKPLDYSCVLNGNREGFYIRTPQKEGEDLIFEVEKPKTEIDILNDKLVELGVTESNSNVFISIDEIKLKKLYKDVYKGIANRKLTWNQYRLEIYRAGVEYLVHPNSIHRAFQQIEIDIKKFRPSPDYVLSEVLRKNRK